MSRDDCFRVLDVAPNASWDEIRQAYKDLVRVWHPDRFQSDPHLKDKAEQELKRINEAYLGLKNLQMFGSDRPEPPPPPRPAPPPEPAGDPAVNVRPHSRGGHDRFLWSLHFGGPIKAAWLGLVCLAPLIIGVWLVNALRVPTLESLAGNGPSRPLLLMPSRFVNPFDGRPATADELSNWARGEAMDLWRSIPEIVEKPVESLVESANSVGPQGDTAVSRDQSRHPDNGTSVPRTPANGTELLRTRMYGGSELWVSNPASQDAVAKLVETETASPVRVVYIQAKNKACIRHIAPGVYDLLAETGENWDASHIRFQARRRALGRSGPFQCFDVTSSQGTFGPKFHIVLGSDFNQFKE